MLHRYILGALLFEVILAQDFSNLYNQNQYFLPTGGGKISSDSFFGNTFNKGFEDIYDTPQSFSQSLQNHGFPFSNQLPQSVPGPQFSQPPQSPFQPFGAPPTPDPSTLGCGTPPASCPKTRYRSYDGSCNNLANPVLGAPQTPYARLLPPKYGDGISLPPRAKSGRDLPLARAVSLALFPDVPIEDPKFTLATMQYGQIITHDMSMIAGSTQSTPHQTRCCTTDGQLIDSASMPEHCFPLIFPPNDIQTKQSNIKCQNFVRTITDLDRRCISGNQPAEQLTAVNHYLDLSLVYGNTDQVNQQVRAFQAGKLRVVHRNGKDWLPQNPNSTKTCPGAQSQNEPCYFAGDARVNQNPQLTTLQIILFREHNRLADALALLNPHWNDETIFQEARRINIAQHQHITYYEWLPLFLGLENSLKNKIIYQTHGFVNDYDEFVDPTIINEHSTAAFRFFHALIVGRLDLINEHRDKMQTLRLSDWFNRPAILEQGNTLDDLTRGMATQPERKATQFSDSEITQFLFRMAGQVFGQDLRAVDVQRNRDHGLASYNDFREFCGLSKAHSFEDFMDVILPENVQKLASLYESPDDVDLTVGGSLEKLVPGTLAGPVNLCILTEQFYRTRTGDRFFYENGRSKTGFTLDQLNEIRKASISRLFCDNGNHITSMQPRGFERVTHKNNVVPCESLPVVDLTLWQENKGSAERSYNFDNSVYLYKK